jgi:GT2 family glycosyltransferase
MLPGALAVLFNPSAAHVHKIFRLKRLCADVVVVDNSPVLDLPLHERIQAAGIDILSNFNIGGVAGAYNKGLERLIAKRCDALFMFDQDSEVPEGYFVHMLDACLTLGRPHFLIGPKVFDINVNRYLPAHVIRRLGVTPIPITDEDHGLVPCSSIITSGSVMSAETYRTLGPFSEDYVIDHVDTEYSFRAICNGVPVYINTSLVLKHEVGKRIDHKVLLFTLTQWNTSPLRLYYSARNCIHILRRYGAQYPILILINVITMQQGISVTLYENNKVKKVVAMVTGIIDGLRGRYGSFEACRPRSSAFCTNQLHETA